MIWSFESFSKSSFVYRVYSTHSLLSSHLFLDKFITHSHCQEAQKDIHRIHPPWGAMPWIPGDGSIVWMEFGSHKVGHQAASSCCGSSPVWYSPSRGHGTTNSLARAQIQLKQNTFHSKKETSLIQIFGQCLVCTVLGGKKKNSAPPRYRWIKKTHTHTHLEDRSVICQYHAEVSEPLLVGLWSCWGCHITRNLAMNFSCTKTKTVVFRKHWARPC